jgi:hypothetical protein
MNHLPEFLTGSITSEYGQLSAKGGVKRHESTTSTCGSDCTAGNGQCDPGTCPVPKPKPPKPPRKKAFAPMLPGWNEPPAARL